MRCKHPDIEITEYGTAYTSHTREQGEWSHLSDVDEYTGKIYVECSTCGYSRIFNRFGKNLPKWLKSYLKELNL